MVPSSSSLTFRSLFLATSPYLLFGVAFTDNGIFLTIHACQLWSAKTAQVEDERRRQRSEEIKQSQQPQELLGPSDVHLGFASSHFFLRFLQVRHPVFDRPLVI